MLPALRYRQTALNRETRRRQPRLSGAPTPARKPHLCRSPHMTRLTPFVRAGLVYPACPEHMREGSEAEGLTAKRWPGGFD
jgi:hypothetical protein